MNIDLSERIAAIQRMPRGELIGLWRETFGEKPRSGNTQWMRKRLAWGVQAQVLGGLSEAAEKRIEDLTPLALASMPWGFRSFQKGDGPVSPAKRDRSTPKPGTTITRGYKNKTIVVTVRDDGFEFDGRLFRSLTAVATEITGAHWSGTHFFGLRKRKSA